MTSLSKTIGVLSCVAVLCLSLADASQAFRVDPCASRKGGLPNLVGCGKEAQQGIQTIKGGEGPWIPHCKHVQPGLLIAGTNCVTTDAVGTAIMGYDPLADRGISPFETCDSTLRLAEDMGLGIRDLSRIEVRGVPIQEARFNFKPYHNSPWNVEEPDFRC